MTEPLLVPLDEHEYDVTWPRDHRPAPGPDLIRRTTSLGEGIAGGLGAGLGLLRAAAGLGLRLVGAGGVPAALQAGPLGRALAAPRTASAGPVVTVRADGLPVGVDPASLEDAYPHATDWVAVFLPDVGQTEKVWSRRAGDLGGTYAQRLGSLLGWTPVHLRVTGQAGLPEAGVALHALLQQLVEAWPVGVRRVALVGHGSGGLVLRSALGVRSLSEGSWTDLVSDVVVVGTAQLAATGRTATGSAVGRQLDERLAGIAALEREAVDVPPLDHATYTVVADRALATRHPVGRLVGDLLWWRHTATGRSRRARSLFPTAEVCEFSTAEFPLASHPGVQGLLLDRLA